MLLEEALKQVNDEGYFVIGCYLSNDAKNLELVHFSQPNFSRSFMAKLVQGWLEILEDHDNIRTEPVEHDSKPKLYQA